MNKYQDWPTQQDDMQLASDIIERHTLFNDGEPLGFLNVVMNGKKHIDFKVSDWVIDVVDHFIHRYGAVRGHEIAQKVLTRYLLKNQTIH